jgi:hypothetical protein
MATRKRKTGATGRRARLLGRSLPSVPYPILVDDPTDAQRELERVHARTRQLMLRHDPGSAEYRAAEVELSRAQAAVDACYETVHIRALAPARYEALKAQHPPTTDQLAEQPPPDVDVNLFVPAVLAEAVEGDMTADDWADLLDHRMSDGERQEIRVIVLGINERARFAEPVVLPKGSTVIHSSRWS